MSKRNAIVQPLILAGLVAAGMGLAWGVLVGWSFEVVGQLTPSNKPRKEIRVRVDGTPLVRTHHSGAYGDWTDHTLDGQLAEEGTEQYNLAGGDLRAARLYLPEPAHPWFFHLGWQRRICSFSDGRRPGIFWYFVHDGELDGRGYFVGYDSKAKTLVGYIGAQGSQQEKPPPADWFPVRGNVISQFRGAIASGSYGWGARQPNYYIPFDERVPGRIPPWMVFLVSADRVVQIDLRNRSASVVFESPGLVSVGLLNMAVIDGRYGMKWSPQGPQYLAVRSADRVFLLDSEGEHRYTYSIPAALRGRLFSLYLLADESALLVSSRSGEGTKTEELFWMDQQGEVTKRHEVSYPYGGFAESVGVQSWLGGLAVPAPAIMAPVLAVAPALDYLRKGTEPDYVHALVRVLRQAWPALLAVHVLALVLAVLCWRRQQRFAAARTWVWVALVFLFGVPGFLGYLFCRPWPARKACGACGVDAPRDRESCFACGTDYPEPALKGTEVFAS